jgi:hypothetical protein
MNQKTLKVIRTGQLQRLLICHGVQQVIQLITAKEISVNVIIQTGQELASYLKGTTTMLMISGINLTGNTKVAINTGRLISGQITEKITILKEIRIITIIITGTETGKITAGITIAGEIITGIIIRIHTGITNIIITIIITGM